MRLTFCGCFMVPFLTAQTPAGPYRPAGNSTIATVSKSVAEIQVEKQIAEGARATAALNHPEAIRILENALQEIRANPSLKKMEDGCRVRLGYAYLGPLRLDDALRSFRSSLTPTANCKPAGALEDCAEAQYGVGTVEMYQSDFAGAVRDLTKAFTTYSHAATGRHPDEFRMNNVLQQAKVEGLLGAALFRTGNKPKAIETLRHSVAQLTLLEKDPKLTEYLRQSVHGALLDANKSLDLLLQN